MTPREAAAPMETAAHQHAEDEAALVVSQLTGPGGHSAALMAGREGHSVADTCDPGLPSA